MKKLVSVLVFLVPLLGVVPASNALPTGIEKICEYEGGNGAYCTSWQPTPEACYAIFLKKTATATQKFKCMAYGWGMKPGNTGYPVPNPPIKKP